MNITFECGDEISRDVRQLPSDYYRKILLLFSRCGSENLFIPIRSIQYLAVITRNEIVFVDGQDRRRIESSWTNFRHDSEVLDDPVSYDCVLFEQKGAGMLTRLQGEFLKALELLESRQPKPKGSEVTSLDNR